MIKQYVNAVIMYVYLRWYIYKINSDFRFMVSEALEHGQNLKDS